MFADRLRCRVAPTVDGGRAEHTIVVFFPRHLGIAAVDFGSRAEHNFFVVLVCGLEQVLGAVDVDVERLVRVADVMFDADHRRQVINEIGLGDEGVEQFDVEDAVVDVLEARLAEQMAHLGDRAGVEHEDFVAARDKCVGKMRAEKARAARNQNPHVASIYSKRRPSRSASAPRTSAADPAIPPSNCVRVTSMLPSPAEISAAPSPVIRTRAPGSPRLPDSDAMRAPQMYNLRPSRKQNVPGYGCVTARTRLK